jgi:hypothetical protein
MTANNAKVEQFLNDIHGNNKVNFRLIKESSIKLNGYYSNEKAKLQSMNEQGFNIYFVVNGGGDKDEQITKVNAIFIDFDFPKVNKTLPSLDEVALYKLNQLDKIKKFKQFRPSYIIETRNGLHVYWLVNDGATTDEFLDAQCRLIEYFESDKSIKNLSRVMRLPNFNWVKDINHPFMVNIMERSLNRYTKQVNRYDINSIINALPECTQPIKLANNKASSVEISLGGTNNNGVNNNTSLLYVPPKLNESSQTLQYQIVGALIKRDATFLKQHYKLPHVMVSNNDEYMHYIRSIDLKLVLGIQTEGNFPCVFHKDSSPSSGIFRADDGASMYKCHSSSCGVSYNIVNVIEKLGNFQSRSKAHDFIREIFNVEMAQTEWQREQIFNLDSNIRYLSLDIQQDAPQLYKNIRHQIPYLIKLNVLAKEMVSNERITDDEGNTVFFTSIKDLLKIAELSDKQRKKITDKNSILQYHKLLNKLSDAEIPDDMLSRAKAIQIERGFDKRVNFYSIPSYTTNQIEQSTMQAEKWQENSYTIKGASREMFFRKEGAEVADWLYPQHTHVTNKDGEVVERTTTKKQDEIQSQIVSVIMSLIDERGYCTEKEILNSSNLSNTKAQKYIKTNLPEILDLYNLERVRANKQLKEQFGITGTGSPFLLLKNVK